jgi:hypothetical protein
MNKLLTTITLLCFSSFLPSISNAQLFGPSSYEDCILESMQGVTSDAAAGLIRQACREKFPISQASGSAQNSIGWEIESNGIGRCYLIWDGAKFIQTSARTPPENFSRQSMTTPRDTMVTFFFPQSLKPRAGEDALAQIWRMSGYNFDNTYCGQ